MLLLYKTFFSCLFSQNVHLSSSVNANLSLNLANGKSSPLIESGSLMFKLFSKDLTVILNL